MNAIHSSQSRPAFRPGERLKAVVVESGQRNLAQLTDGTPLCVGGEPVDYHALKWGVIDLATKKGAYDEVSETGVRYSAAEVARTLTSADPAGTREDIEAVSKTGAQHVDSLIVAPISGGRPIMLAQFDSPLAANLVVGPNGTLTWE
ncbi:MAG: hypothetical protein KF760_21190 [Candidatus Eremiobacteraeota bacterium]|nr:hypothetical protein [Candidatus Eremiobacteraeota bacterium]MCW5867288.1 hypothetical protein [Candidatus Eremiobacteraeota bacterium]